jgi:magnesium transporter
MEDVINTYQRPKLEEFDDHLFIVTRLLHINSDVALRNDQLSLFLFKNTVITFQEGYEDHFEPIRSRLRTGKGQLRSASSDYMAYALLDSVVDHYFPLLEKLGEKLDELEDELFTKPTRSSLHRIQQIKRELIVLRRTVFAERDKVNDLLRTASALIRDQTKLYLRDTYDHTIQVMDLVESYKEIVASLMEIYLSSVSFRLNQVMKVLAIISTIFIPLTFIVGVYGMNFSYTDPVSGEVLSWNMPELYSPFGYAGVMLFMLVLVVIQLVIFWRKGWLDKS